MATPLHSRLHWSHVSVHFAIDLLGWISAFLVATLIRFVGSDFEAVPKLLRYFPGLLIGGIALAATCYICGLYSRHNLIKSARRRYLLVFVSLLVALLATFSYGSMNFSARIGRGVILLGIPMATAIIALHHVWLTERARSSRDRMICLIASPADKLELQLLLNLPQRYHEIVGCVVVPGLSPTENVPTLGDLNDLERLIATENIGTVFCTSGNRHDQKVSSIIRQLRYSGVRVATLTSLCEEVFQAIPISLIDNDWLMTACATSSHFYNAKLKRSFDVVLALFFMVVLAPFLLLGVISVAISSGRPIFYTQVRSGKFGRKIEITKLRTMNANAEVEGGAQWSVENDPRITPVGKFLRRFRIDEIPQLWSVMRGELSFVGPRPERPEFIDDLTEEIPCYKERLLVQPGLTGWAQVSYPYGSSVDDTRRKLEFDLYYMKNLSPLLDAFVLLDTIKIILSGGASRQRGALLTHFQEHLLIAEQKRSALRKSETAATQETPH